ncbi:MAG: VOC family protein [Balneolaceae bacterium]|jgi:catechol 2,3-dioxygenase-like lactoylglutathione lyase family enzyme
MKINHLDHLVLTVRNIEKTVAFYNQILGMSPQEFGNDRIALPYGSQKINLHEFGNEFEPKALNAKPGSSDLCFITDTPIEQVVKHLRNEGVKYSMVRLNAQAPLEN